MSFESTNRNEKNNLGLYLKNSYENLLQGVKHVGILKSRGSVSKKDFKKLMNEKRVENWKEKQMYGQFIRNMLGGTGRENPWLWIRKCDLKIPTEVLICSKKGQVIRTDDVKYHIDKRVD